MTIIYNNNNYCYLSTTSGFLTNKEPSLVFIYLRMRHHLHFLQCQHSTMPFSSILFVLPHCPMEYQQSLHHQDNCCSWLLSSGVSYSYDDLVLIFLALSPNKHFNFGGTINGSWWIRVRRQFNPLSISVDLSVALLGRILVTSSSLPIVGGVRDPPGYQEM